MTSPDGSTGGGEALGPGQFALWQATTEQDAKGRMTTSVGVSWSGAQGSFGQQVFAPLNGQAGTISNHETRIISLEDGGTLTVYAGNDVWINPGVGRIGVGVVCGGQAGQDGLQSTSPAGGGVHGGYSYREFNCGSLPSTVDVSVGAGGSSNGQGGGISQFGTLLIGQPATAGSILSNRGAMSSSSTPGVGGQSAAPNVPAVAGTAGTASALALGGDGGVDGDVDGKPGGSMDLDSITPCGGGGGGAGASMGGIGGSPGLGGAGGAPGGGGGAGGNRALANSGATRVGGPGGNGRVWVRYSTGV